MAFSAKYDKYQDSGLAFSAADVETFSPEEWAKRRVTLLCGVVRTLERRSELPDVEKPKWVQRAVKLLLDGVCGWYCYRIVGQAIDRDEVLALPDPRSKEGKELTQTALGVVTADLLDEWISNCNTALTYVVSLCRSKPMDRNGKKAANKLVNAIEKELNAWLTLKEEYQASPTRKQTTDQGVETDA